MSTPSAPTALADGLDAIAHALARGVAQTSTSTSASAKSRERFDAMAGLIEHARDKNDAVRALRATEDALVACVVRPEGEMSATRASMTLGALYEATDGGSLYSRANELLDAATTSTCSPGCGTVTTSSSFWAKVEEEEEEDKSFMDSFTLS